MGRRRHSGIKAFIIAGLIAAAGMSGYIYADHQGIAPGDILEHLPFISSDSTSSGSSGIDGDTASSGSYANPLTGIADGFDPAALDQRPAAFVVENTPDARPQWGMDDPLYSPDIILEGEVEGGITRTLWLYADYNKLPEIIGPMRSARPPYIRFSELFDAYFIHWGQSGSKDNYIGANTVFKQDKVDHINEMTFDDKVGLYDRDQTRTVSAEHRGILYGAKVPAAIEQEGFRTEPEEYTHLEFSDLPWLTSFEPAAQVKVDFSAVTSWETTVWTYNDEDRMYHTANFNNDLARDNLLILFDDTEYIDKYDYQGIAGYTVTYCDYKFSGGDALLLSRGTIREIEWEVEDGRLILTDPEYPDRISDLQLISVGDDSSSEEAASDSADEGTSMSTDAAALSPGKTWIGWVSRNNGGRVEVIPYLQSDDSDGTWQTTGDGAHSGIPAQAESRIYGESGTIY